MESNKFIKGQDMGIPDMILDLVIRHITDQSDRAAVSQVCRFCYELDSQTRKHLTISFCYTISPDRLRARFPHIESLKLKGKPRAAMFSLIPDDWGGFAGPWLRVLADPTTFASLKSVHLRRMVVKDSDLQHFASSRGRLIHVLKLDKCSGFSTDGLLHVARHCRHLRILFMEECEIDEKDGDWLHEIALHHTLLEVLNFYLTYLTKLNEEDLVLIGINCRSLVSVKICDIDFLDLVNFFGASSSSLKEFCGGSFNATNEEQGKYSCVTLPRSITYVGLGYLGNSQIHLLLPISAGLIKLVLLYSLLNTEDHCFLLQRCPNLQVLETRNVIGDRGLQVVASNCKRLKRLRVERGDDENGLEDEDGFVTQRGLIAIAEGCTELEKLAVYVADITNSAFEHIGANLKNLTDFRLVLLNLQENISDLPLDSGVRTLLLGCEKLTRLALYLRNDGLTDLGLSYIGQYGVNVEWMLLGSLGNSDEGLMAFSRGCPRLVKLEMRGCQFSERALARAVLQLPALRYIWVQGYRPLPSGLDLLANARPGWNIELIPPTTVTAFDMTVNDQRTAQILAYCSLAGPRTDCPDYVISFAT